MRHHDLIVSKLSVACQWIKELSTHRQNRDRSAAAAIFANGTYFLDTLRIYITSHVTESRARQTNGERSTFSSLLGFRGMNSVPLIVNARLYKSFGNMKRLKYFKMKVGLINENCFDKQIEKTLNSLNYCYQEFRIFCLPASNLETRA
jgi:hypothetical protein